MPAKKAPNANETWKSHAAPTATPRPRASTANVNSSREPESATLASNQGMARRPTMTMSATKPPTLTRVHATLAVISPGVVPPVASTGTTTSATTMARSSTMSQPTEMWPARVSSNWRSSSARSITTVEATDRHRPKSSAPSRLQPSQSPKPVPAAVATAIWPMAPGSATRRTARSSLTEK